MFKAIRLRAVVKGLLSVLLVASPSLLSIPTTSVATAGSCGEWRWGVKTLSDPDRRDVNFVRRRIRIQKLRRLNSPGPYDGMPRTGPVETQVYQVRASVREATVEDDSDIHLVIAQRGAPARTMIVEFPDPRCVDSAFHRRQIRHARDQMLNNCGPISSSSFTDLKGRVSIRGVGFWDEIHGQTGVAPNGIELHPVLSIRGTCSHRGAGGGGGGGGGEEVATATLPIPLCAYPRLPRIWTAAISATATSGCALRTLTTSTRTTTGSDAKPRFRGLARRRAVRRSLDANRPPGVAHASLICARGSRLCDRTLACP